MARIYKKSRQGIAGTLLRKVAGDSTFDQAHFMGSKALEAQNAKRAAEAEANKPAIPMPDEEELARIRRRRARRTAGSRESTQLTGDTLGPGY